MESTRRVVGLDYSVQGMSIPQRERVVREKVKVREDKSHVVENEVKGLFKYFCTALVCMALLLGQGVYINNQGVEMGKLNGMIEEYKLSNDKNIIKISNLSSLENIEKTAINEYNMVKPERIQYLLR
jgi:hypothetical protein